MMRFGLCTATLAPDNDPVGSCRLQMAKKAGYDYVELPLAQMMDLPDSAFAELRRNLRDLDLPCEATNNFMPKSIPVTGPNVNPVAIAEYLKRAFDRASALGVQNIVFGSSGSRNVPDGFDRANAWEQIKSFLYLASEEAKPHDLTIVIECINHGEGNIINSTRDGTKIMEEVNLPNVCMLVDYYHYIIEKDVPADILKLGDKLQHTHFSQPIGRVLPTMAEFAEYQSFFEILKQISYQGRMSIEGFSAFPERDITEALAVLRALNF